MKKGISLVSLAIVIIVMVILAGIVVVTGFNSAENATINTFALEILNIQNAVDEYHSRYEKYPVADEYVLDITTIPSESLDQFEDETTTNNKITFKILDLSLIGVTDTEFGNGTDNDLYILSETTGKAYYLKGVDYEGATYYTLTDELKKSLDIKLNDVLYAHDIKVQDVIFTPSETDYTNIPVTVQVKLPLDATITSVAADVKSVSAETTSGMYKMVVVNETTADKTGNYTITVNYEYEGLAKTAQYAVTNFDNIAPTLSVTETEEENIKTISINATDAGSGIRKIKYEEQEVDDNTYFLNYGKELDGTQITLNINGAYTIYVEDKAGNYSTIVEIGESGVPAAWRTNVTTLYNRVPIPKGFVASHATGENTRDGGLVIYEGTIEVTDENVEEARRSRNQYVWVPVDIETFDTTFVRQDFGMGYTISSTLGTSSAYWEELHTTELNDTNLKYMTEDTLEEVQAMYASVKKYGGFYIARYEAGIDEQRTAKGKAEDLQGIKEGTKVYSVMGKIPYTWIPWTWNNVMNEDTNGAVEVARRMYPESNTNYGVVSTLTYGVQWDRTIQWFIDTKAMTEEQVNSSGRFGNYRASPINTAEELNEGALVWDYTASTTGSYVAKDSDTLTYPKAIGTKWALSTGALKAANVNNIYDMAGNMWEWTMEGSGADYRVRRGGGFDFDASADPISDRYDGAPNYGYNRYGFRSSLYIK